MTCYTELAELRRQLRLIQRDMHDLTVVGRDETDPKERNKLRAQYHALDTHQRYLAKHEKALVLKLTTPEVLI